MSHKQNNTHWTKMIMDSWDACLIHAKPPPWKTGFVPVWTGFYCDCTVWVFWLKLTDFYQKNHVWEGLSYMLHLLNLWVCEYFEMPIFSQSIYFAFFGRGVLTPPYFYIVNLSQYSHTHILTNIYYWYKDTIWSIDILWVKALWVFSFYSHFHLKSISYWY
jgi:hypothetical protein